jgi:hypothetical protein
MSREEIIAAIKKTTEELGRVPSLEELVEMNKVSRRGVRQNFLTYKAVLEACGLERSGPGYEISLDMLFRNWAGVVRRLGRLPSIAEFEVHGKHSLKPVTRQFGGWREVPGGMAQYAREHGLEDEWKDVLEVVAGHLKAEMERAGRQRWSTDTTLRPGVVKDEPVYGEAISGAALMGADGMDLPLLLAPTNEQGVVLLFGAVARKLGFVVLRIQTEYPDCEALREMEPGRWQRTPIEFELESKNFLLHGHALERCKVIVCWEHNWKECPVEVIELRSAIGRKRLTIDPRLAGTGEH